MTIRMKEAVAESNSLPERVPRRRVVNILNHANFMGEGVVVNLRNLQTGSGLALKAAPEPCRQDTVRLTWTESPPADVDRKYDLIEFCIGMGTKLLIIGGRLIEISRSGITVLLPEHSYAVSRRRVERHSSMLARVTLSRSNEEVAG